MATGYGLEGPLSTVISALSCVFFFFFLTFQEALAVCKLYVRCLYLTVCSSQLCSEIGGPVILILKLGKLRQTRVEELA